MEPSTSDLFADKEPVHSSMVDSVGNKHDSSYAGIFQQQEVHELNVSENEQDSMTDFVVHTMVESSTPTIQTI